MGGEIGLSVRYRTETCAHLSRKKNRPYAPRCRPFSASVRPVFSNVHTLHSASQQARTRFSSLRVVITKSATCLHPCRCEERPTSCEGPSGKISENTQPAPGATRSWDDSGLPPILFTRSRLFVTVCSARQVICESEQSHSRVVSIHGLGTWRHAVAASRARKPSFHQVNEALNRVPPRILAKPTTARGRCEFQRR